VGGWGGAQSQQQGNPGNNGEGKTRTLARGGALQAREEERALWCGAARWLAGKGAGGRVVSRAVAGDAREREGGGRAGLR
jgi:hypothetical protein